MQNTNTIYISITIWVYYFIIRPIYEIQIIFHNRPEQFFIINRSKRFKYSPVRKDKWLNQYDMQRVHKWSC